MYLLTVCGVPVCFLNSLWSPCVFTDCVCGVPVFPEFFVGSMCIY